MTIPNSPEQKLIEEWRPVHDYEKRYEVSSHGRVRSLRYRNKVSDKLRKKPLILKPGKDRKGYLLVSLCGTTHKIAALVCEAFHGPRPSRFHAAHLDGNNSNNHKNNVAWVSAKENIAHKKLHGTMACGSRQGSSKLTENQIIKIRESLAKGITGAKLAKQYGCCQSSISSIKHRKLWTHV